jgi:hypothetical protein
LAAKNSPVFFFSTEDFTTKTEPTFENLTERATSKLFDDFKATLENFLALYQHF